MPRPPRPALVGFEPMLFSGRPVHTAREERGERKRRWAMRAHADVRITCMRLLRPWKIVPSFAISTPDCSHPLRMFNALSPSPLARAKIKQWGKESVTRVKRKQRQKGDNSGTAVTTKTPTPTLRYTVCSFCNRLVYLAFSQAIVKRLQFSGYFIHSPLIGRIRRLADFCDC